MHGVYTLVDNPASSVWYAAQKQIARTEVAEAANFRGRRHGLIPTQYSEAMGGWHFTLT